MILSPWPFVFYTFMDRRDGTFIKADSVCCSNELRARINAEG